MIKNRLFIVEGVPCTGKTTTSYFISKLLSENGYKVIEFPEGKADHPADYDFHAYITKYELDQFTKDEKEILLRYSHYKSNGYVISLKNIKVDLFNKAIKYKIYDMLPWEKEYPVMLDKWDEFSENAMKNEFIYVFDCCFLQNPLCETMMRFNMKYEEINDFIHEIYNRIKELNPVVVYLKNTEIKERIKEVSKERDSKWLDDVIDYHISQGYGKASGYKDFDGYIECLKARQNIELSILENLDIRKIIIEDPYINWDDAHRDIKNFIYDLR